MKVELSIKDDKELRNLIKDMIRGQVVSITRENVGDMILESIRKGRIGGLTTDKLVFLKTSFDNELKDKIKQYKNDMDRKIKTGFVK